VPVMLHYTRADGGLLISKVVVRAEPPQVAVPAPVVAAPARTATTTTETTVARVEPVEPLTMAGTITNFVEDSITVRTAAGLPEVCRFSDTTQWLDINGRVVARESILKGSPVTIYYTKTDELGMVASKVVVGRPVPAGGAVERSTIIEERPAPAVIRERRTIIREGPSLRDIEENNDSAETPRVIPPPPRTRIIEERKKVEVDDDDD
jgi:hypothetical protein